MALLMFIFTISSSVSSKSNGTVLRVRLMQCSVMSMCLCEMTTPLQNLSLGSHPVYPMNTCQGDDVVNIVPLSTIFCLV